MSGYYGPDWASPQLLALAEAAEQYADTLQDGSTERGLVREAIRKIELADTYIEKRLRDEVAPRANRFVRCPTCHGEFDEGEWDASSECPECETPKVGEAA